MWSLMRRRGVWFITAAQRWPWCWHLEETQHTHECRHEICWAWWLHYKCFLTKFSILRRAHAYFWSVESYMHYELTSESFHSMSMRTENKEWWGGLGFFFFLWLTVVNLVSVRSVRLLMLPVIEEQFAVSVNTIPLTVICVNEPRK